MEHKMQNDAALVRHYLNGDEQAFHQLIIKYQPDIYALILSYVKDPEDAKEITQDVFFEAYKCISSLRQPESFRFWLRQIARNQYHIWRRRERANIVPLENIASDAIPADELLILRESFAEVIQIIDELPEMEKEILRSRFLDDASYEELQKKHRLSYKSLTMRLLRARKKVREKARHLLLSAAILSSKNATQKIAISGGVGILKASVKIKIITIGIVAAIISGGTGVYIWRSRQPSAELSIHPALEITRSDPQQTSAKSADVIKTDDAVASKPIRQEIVKPEEEPKKVITKNQPILSGKNSQEQKIESPEELLKRYKEFRNSSKFQAELEEETFKLTGYSNIDPVVAEIKANLADLQYDKQLLEYELAIASEKDQSRISEKLGKVRNDIRETRIQERQLILLGAEAVHRVIHRYFTNEEVIRAVNQMAVTGEVFSLPSPGDEEQALTDESIKRLRERGIILSFD